MAESDREKWNNRYRTSIGNQTPSELLKKYLALAKVGRALDIACGNGRNSIYLADNGFRVDAVDISSIAIDILLQQAPNINAICEDLESFSISWNSYDLIINANFLDRRLVPLIIDGLRADGLILFESFTGSKTTQYCLGPNELLHIFSPLHILYYEEKDLADSEKFDKSVSLAAIKKA